MKELKLAIFDLGGTTIQDGGQAPRAFAATLSEQGLHATADEIKAVRGASKRQALLQFIPAGPDQSRLAEEAYGRFQGHLADLFAAEGVRAIPGAESMLRSLRERGVEVAFNTGFDRDTTAMLLRALNWGNNFVDAVVCGDEVPQGRPAPYLIFRAMEACGVIDVHQVAVVGDTALDLLAGYHAGTGWNVGVLSGAHDRQTLEAAPHTHILPSVAVLEQVWSKG